ncbi:MAG: hypothetical protein JSR59_21620 [Proteobacteria bacterium]|nr:hypothetical protein [Pseudomonadota bacterium]
MSGSLLPEASYGGEPDPQTSLPLATDGVQRVVWHLATGPILIEVRDGEVFVNGGRVEPLAETLRRGVGPDDGRAAEAR